MIITPDLCRLLARYNAWQNRQISDVVLSMPTKELDKDRGAFFGSIHATLNHLLWGDTIWMSRFTGGPTPPGGIPNSGTMTPTIAVWSAERFRMDGQIINWANTVKAVDLSGPLTWYSGGAKAQRTKPFGLLVMHMFNHQTHHRGQVHAMLTAAGQKAPVTDMILLPEE